MTINPNDVDRVVQEARTAGEIPNLRGANLRRVKLNGANLNRATLKGANLYGADLHSADLRGADLRYTNLYDAKLYGADLHSADLHRSDLYCANLRGANLHDANLSDSHLRGANLSGADLRGANLRAAILNSADLIDADLRGADLRSANLIGADLSRANLHGADLRGANLHDVQGWDGLQITGFYNYQIQLIPTPDRWTVSIGCWEGTPAQLKELISQDEGWPESEGDQIPENRTLLTAALAVIEAHISKHPDTISHLKKFRLDVKAGPGEISGTTENITTKENHHD